MKNGWIAFISGFACLWMSTTAFAATQTVFSSPANFDVSPGDTVEFTVQYSSLSPDNSSGLGLKLYFDSSSLLFSEVSGVLADKKVAQSVGADSADGDGNSDTDSLLNIAWADISGQWPGTGNVDTALMTVKFIATQAFSTETTLFFTGSTGIHSFASTPVVVSYKDNVPPIITAPTAVTIEATSTTTNIQPEQLGIPTVTDNKDNAINASYSPQGPFTVGEHVITWTATDSSNNSATATQLLTIEDTAAPQVIAPADISTVALGALTSVTLGTPVIIETVDNNPTIVADKTGPFALGTHTITWTATDASNNQGTATQVVVITEPGVPILTAPADITKEATGALTSVSFGSLSGTDVIDGDITASHNAPATFAVGTHTITWTVTNSRNASTTATQTVTITDTTGPALTAPPSKTVQATGVNTTVNIGTATATDLVDETVTITSNSPVTFTVGTHTVIWTARDSRGNTSTAEQTITVSDSDNPSITAPENLIVEATGALTAVDLGTATASDVVDGVLTATPNKTGPFALGTHLIEWTATDSANNSATAIQTVVVQDTTAPTIEAPANKSVVATSLQTAVDLGVPTVSDLVDTSPDVVANNTEPFGIGVHTIIWTATDAKGNSATAEQTLTITDPGAPTLTAPAEITKEATGALTSVSFGSLSGEDVIDGDITASHNAPASFAVGTHTVTWTVTNSRNASTTATQTVTITDNTAPSLTAPPSKTVQATGANTTIDIGTATATDLVDETVTITSNSPATFTVGSHTVIWTARDSRGNTSIAEQTITVSDSDNPSITAPENLIVEATGALTAVDLGTATASDVVDGVLTATPNKTGPFALGTHLIEWTATDSANNSATAIQTVVVQDTTAPVIEAPADKSVVATSSQTAVDLGVPTVSDLVDTNPVVVANNTEPFGIGVHTIIWTATDAKGNSETAEQTVTITDPGAPTLTAPADITKEATATLTNVIFENLIGTDVIDGDLTATNDALGSFAVGSHTITWTVTNSRNASVEVTQTLTITDTTVPTLIVPPSKTVQATGAETTVDIGIATATDLVDETVTITSDSPATFTVGTHTITWTAKDSKGNTATGEQTITVSDADGPSITAPENLTVEATAVLTSVELGSATASDAVDGAITATPNETGPFGLGTHLIEWTATDSAGNSASATQIVTVQDTTAPSIEAPVNKNVSATSQQTPVNLGTPTVTDLVDTNPVIDSNLTGPFNVGVHTITWTVTDASNNSASATQTITVTDTGKPTIKVPASITKEATGALTPVSIGSAIANDVVDGSLIVTPDITGPFTVGIHTITWTATDSNDNQAAKTQKITVTDNTPPQIQVPGSLSVLAAGEVTQVDIGTATAIDIVDNSVSVTSDAPSSFTVGEHTVTWTAVDAEGNTATATQKVTVTDGDGPALTAPSDITVEATGETTQVALGTATASDAVDGELTATPDNSGPFTIGSHVVIWSVTDSAGNEATVSQTVIVEDTTAPTITVGSSVLQVEATGVFTSTTDFGITAVDIIDGELSLAVFLVVDGVEQELPQVGFRSGIHQLVWKATDSAGNTAIAQQTVEVTPRVDFVTTQAVSAGEQVVVGVELSGEAISYPVTVPYSINTQASTIPNDGSGHDAVNGEILIESGTTGSFSFNVAENPQLSSAGKGDLVFTMGAPQNAVTGSASTHRVIISAGNIAPVVTVQITQGASNVTKVTKDAGRVQILAQASDNQAQTLSYDWGQSDTALLDLAANSNSATFEIDPSTLAEGSYKAVIVVSDDGSPSKSTTIIKNFKVVAGAVAIIDSDGDGIEDSKDNITQSNRVPEDEGGIDTYILESEPGTTLKLGNVALDQELASAGVDSSDLPGVPEEFTDTALEIYDFEISGIAPGENTRIVIPQHVAIPPEAVYLKTDGNTWRAFAEDENNIIYSAEGTSTGVCPAAGDIKYTQGLTAGHYCVQLKIEDGGANDTDGLVNGSIADPGAVVGPAPTLTAPADITKEATGNTTPVSFGTVTGTDVLDGELIATADNAGPFTVGIHTITWTIINSRNTTVTATQKVTITDTTGPTITAPPSKTVHATGASTTVNLGAATATDLVDGSVAVTSNSNGIFAVGTHTVTWSATDAKGNTSTAEQTITVSDADGPAITAPANITIEATGVTTPVNIGTATASDAVDGTLTATSDKTSPFALGTHVITWIATDSAGNKATATQTVVVQDTTAPTITAPTSQTVTTSLSQVSVNLGSPVVADLVDANPSVTADKSGPFSIGIHTITWTVTDASGNSATATQTVRVNARVITTPTSSRPTITAPEDITQEASGTTTAVTLGEATAFDRFDGTLTATANNTGPFSVGVHIITWTTTNNRGFRATDRQRVIITDTTGPEISAPPSKTVKATGESTLVDIGTATANDLVDGAVSVSTDHSGSLAIGTHTIIWTAVDGKGNISTVEQIITVSDSDGPSIIAPANQTVEATAALTSVNLGTAIVTDEVDGTLTATPDQTGPFTPGIYTINWTATDSGGNTATVPQTIIVQDTIAPTIQELASQTVEATGETTTIDLGQVTAIDAVDGALTATPDSIDSLVIGTHLITWTATDSAGNSTTVTQVVTVIDTIAPEITVNAATLQVNATGVLTSITEYGVSATDLVDGTISPTVTIVDNGTQQPLSQSSLTSGVHQLVWTATDNAGNTATAQQIIEITPQANFVATQTASAGDQVTVTVKLSGEAVSYPVTIPYSIDTQTSTVTHDGTIHNANNNGQVVIESGTTGSFIFNVDVNPLLSGVGEGDLIFIMGTPLNAVSGTSTTHKVTISLENQAPQVDVVMTQGGTRVTRISKDAGDVLITAVATDSASQILSYDWSQSDVAIADLATDSDEATFEVDPSQLTDGIYKVVIAVRDDGSPLAETIVSRSFKVVAGTTPVTDSDGDGIEDEKDNVSATNRLPEDAGGTNTYIIESEPGTTLRLGDIALEQEQDAAGIKIAGLPAIPNEYSSSSVEIYDFIVDGVAKGKSTFVIIPQHTAIPVDAVYLKSDGTVWSAFVEDENNSIFSAAATTTGICPSTSDSQYTLGLTAGDDCVQLQIEDGGTNDADGLVNGSVADPGAVFGLTSSVNTPSNSSGGNTDIDVPAVSSSGSSGGGGAMSWYLMWFLVMVGFVRSCVVRKPYRTR